MGLLFMGYSVREICRKLEINPKTFYDHVDHIASRCRRKLAMIDARWVNHAKDYEFASHYQRLQPQSNNGVVWIATGEAHSGYILCQHVNYSQNEEPSRTLTTTLMMMWLALYPKTTLQKRISDCLNPLTN